MKRLLTFVLFLTPACGTYYNIPRAASVGHIEPTMRTGAPVTSPVELNGHASVVSSADEGGDDAGLYVSRVDTGGELRLRVDKNIDVDLQGDVASRSSFQTRDDIPSQPDGLSYSVGVGMQAQVPIAPRVRFAVALSLSAIQIPFHNGGDVPRSDVETVAGTSAAAIARWEPQSDVGVFASLTLRNHPENFQDTSCESLIASCNPEESGVTFGTFYLIAAVGAEVRVTHALALQSLVYLPQGLNLTANLDGKNPVTYGPGLSVGSTLSF